jgi:regulatory protein
LRTNVGVEARVESSAYHQQNLFFSISMYLSSKIDFTRSQRKQKVEKYCAYQERSHQQVRDKLYQLGGHTEEVENAIMDLIESDFLNESRFVEGYVRGKFNMKGWGRNKIRFGLLQHRIDKKMITTAVYQIDDDLYMERLKKTIDEKLRRLKEKNPYKRKAALIRFAAQRGFETDLIHQVLNEKSNLA